MAKNDGILIDVGFKSDGIDSYIEEIESKFKNADLGKNLFSKIDTSVSKELKTINTLLNEINQKNGDDKYINTQIAGYKKLEKQIENINNKREPRAFTFENSDDIEIAIDKIGTYEEKLGEFFRLNEETQGIIGFKGIDKSSLKFAEDYLSMLQQLSKGITKAVDAGKLSEEDAINYESLLPPYERAIEEIQLSLQAGYSKVRQIILKEQNLLYANSTVPIPLKIDNKTVELEQQIAKIIDSLKQYTSTQIIPLKVELTPADNGKAVQRKLSQLNKLMPTIDEEGTKEKAQKILNSISETMIRTFQIKVNTKDFEEQAKTIQNILANIKSQVADINKDLVFKPTIDTEDVKSRLEAYQRQLNDAAGKMSNNKFEVVGSEGSNFVSNLDLVINKFQTLISEEKQAGEEAKAADNGLVILMRTLAQMSDLINRLSDANFSKTDFVSNLKKIKNALKIDSNNGIEKQIDAVISKSDTLYETLGKVDVEKIKTDSANYKEAISNFTDLKDTYQSFLDVLEKKPNLENIESGISSLNTSISQLNTDKISQVENINTLAESFDASKLNTMLNDEQTTIANFVNNVEGYKSQYAEALSNMSENTSKIKVNLDLTNVEKDLSNISSSISNINVPIESGSVIEGLNDLLTKESAIDKLVTLFNSPLGQSLQQQMKLPEIDTKAVANSGLEKFYSSVDNAKSKLSTALKVGDLTSVNEYYRAVLKMSEEYNKIKRTSRDIIPQEEFEKARTQLESFVKDTQSMINSMFDNLHPSLKASLENEIDEIQVHLKATELKPKKISGAKDIEDNKAALIEVLDLQKRINQEGLLAKSVAEAERRLDSLQGKLNSTTSAFDKAIASPTTTNLDKLNTELTSLLQLKEKISNDRSLELISDKQEQDAIRKISNVISSFKESYKLDLAKQFSDIPIDNYKAKFVNIDEAIESAMTALNNFDIDKFNKEITNAASGVDNLRTSLEGISNFGKEADSLITSLGDLPKMQRDAFKGSPVDVNEFIQKFEEIRNKYLELKDFAAQNGLDFTPIETSMQEMLKVVGAGYQTLIKNTKKVYSDIETINKNNSTAFNIKSAVSDSFKSGDMSVLKDAMLKANAQAPSLWSNQNVVANGLAYEKVLGKIYASLVQNSRASGDLKNKLRALAKEMETTGSGNASKTLLDDYTKRFQALDTEIKKSGRTGRGFFERLTSSMTTQTTQLIAMTFSFYRLISVFKQGIQTATEFDTTLAKINYTMDVSEDTLNGMGDSMLKLASELKTSLSNIESAYTIYANMNTSDAEIENLTKYTAILSNLSGIDASSAADDIQAVVNQFENLDSTDTSHIVDVFDYISRNIAVDYSKGIEGIAEGVQAVGNVADQAGLSYEQLSAIIAKTMEQTRNSGSSIANGLKTIMVRLSKASSMSDEVDNSTLSNASKVLHDIGIEVYTAAGEYREFDTIMTELSKKWDTLTESQQANISFQIAATRQTATLKAILQNWTDSMNLATGAVETQGNALENQEKYAETYAAKIQEMKTSFQEMWVNILRTDGMDAVLSGVESLTGAFSNLASTLGLIPTAIAAISFIPLLKNITHIKQGIGGLFDAGALVSTKTSTLEMLKGQAASAKQYGLALDGLNAKQAALAVSTSSLTEAEKVAALEQYALTQAIITTDSATIGAIVSSQHLEDAQVAYINTQITAAKATNSLTEAKLREILATKQLELSVEQQNFIAEATIATNTAQATQVGLLAKLKTGWSNLAASIGLTGGQLGIVVAGIAALVVAYKAFQKWYVSQKEYTDNLTESVNELTQAENELNNLNTELDTTKNKIAELQNKADSGTITIVEQEELNKLKEENSELERNIALQKEKEGVAAEKAFQEAKKSPTEGFSAYTYNNDGYDFVLEKGITGSKVTFNAAEENYEKLTDALNETLDSYEKTTEGLKAFNEEMASGSDISTKDAEKVVSGYTEKIDDIKNVLIDNIDLLVQQRNAYEAYQNSGHTFTEKEQKNYDDIVETMRNYYKKMYDITHDEAYFDAMEFDDQFEIFRQNVIKRITEAYGADGNFVATYLEGVFNEIKEKGVIPKDFDLSKLESANISAQMFKMSDGVSFAFDTSNVSEEEKQGLEEHVKSLYAQAKAKVEAEGKTVNHNTILEAMLVLDDTGLDYIDNYVEQVTNYVEQAFQEQGNALEPKVSFEDAWAELDNLSSDDPLSGFKEEVTKLAEEGKLSKENFLKIDGAKTWADKLNIDLDEALRKMNELSKDTDRLSNFKGVVSKLQNAYSEKRDAVLTNKDATKQNEKLNQVEAVSASTMADLEKDFGHLDSWKKYKETLGSVTSTTDECLKATNDLLTEYYNLGKVINEVVDSTGEVDKATRDYYISQLDELGIANAEEVIDEEIFKRQVELKLSKLNLKDATDEEIQMTMSEIEALDDESVSAEYAMNTINALVKQKLTAGKTSLSNSEDISYLNDLITNAKLAGYNVDKLIQAKLDLQNAASIGSGGASVKDFLTKRGNESYQDWLDDDAVEQQIKISTKKPKKNNGGNNGGGGGGNSTKKDTTEFIDWIARHLEEVNHKIESEKIKLENTFGEKARNKIYKNIDKYWKANIKANKIGAKKYEDSYKGFLKDNKKKLGKNLINKIENGDITGSYKQLIKEYGESTAKLINEGIRRRKAMLEAQDEVGKSITSRRNDRIQELQEHADNRQAESDLYRLRSEKTEEGYKKQNYWLEKAKGQEKASLNIQMDIAKIQKDKTKQLEIQEKLNKLNNQYAAEEFDIMQESYDRKKDLIQDRISLAQSLIDLAAARGAKASIDYYQDIINIDNELIKQNKNNIRDAKESLKGLTYNSKEYEEKLKQIHTLEIEGNNLLADKAQQTKNIVDTYTSYVDALREGNNLISEELNFVDGLGDRYKHTSEEVKNFYTEAGNAALVVNAKNIEISKENQDILKKSYDSLLSAFNDPNRIATLMSGQSIYVNVVDRNTRKVTKLQINSYAQLKEYVKKYYSDLKGEVKAQYDYENKLIDLKKEQYTEELNLVKKLIDAKKEELDAEKDLHDYQRTISEKATNITNLERQLAAYSGNTSEEGRAKLQSLQQQLKEAQEDLNETEYDRYISDQKNMLEGLQKEYEEAIQKILDDPERLLKEAQEDVKNGFADTNKFLSKILEKYDYTPEYQKSVLTRMNDLKEEMRNQEHVITEASGLLSKLGSDNGGAGKEANTGLTNNSEYKPKSGGSNNSKSNTNKKASKEKENNPIGTRDGLIKAIKKIVDNKKYQKKDTKNISEVNKLIYKKYKKALTTTGLKQVAELFGVPYSKEKNSKLWKSLKDLGFSKGGIAKLIKKNGDDGIATLKRGEAVLTPLQTKQFAILANNLKNINQLMEAQSRMANIAELQSRLNESINDFYNSARDVSYGDITFEFNLPNVTDSKQFIYAIQNDVKVQKAIQSVTIDQIYKQSTLYSSRLKSKSIK